MQKVKEKPKSKRKKKIPPLRIIQFTVTDAKANAKRTLTDAQKPRLYKAMNKHLVKPIHFFVVISVLLTTYVFPATGLSRTIWLAIVFAGLFAINEIGKQSVLDNVKITSFVGTANPYQDDTGWYVQFDDVMKFEIKDQPNKLFKSGHRYRVFMTQNDNIILSAREVNE